MVETGGITVTRRDNLTAHPDGDFTRGETYRARYDLTELEADVNAREDSETRRGLAKAGSMAMAARKRSTPGFGTHV
ncbi:hypothetical protein [Rhodococcus wratislaviensis]|nr:hypothetical protein [Rhodococcus wratislaviensis]